MKWYQDMKFYISLMSKHSYNSKLCQAWIYICYLCSECNPQQKVYMDDIRNISLYLKLTIILGYFHQEIQDMTMIWYNDIGSFFDSNNAISMTEFDGIAFIWKSSKWALMAISSYHSDIIALSKKRCKICMA